MSRLAETARRVVCPMRRASSAGWRSGASSNGSVTPEDRRVVLVGPTDAGRTAVQEADAARQQHLRRLILERMTPADAGHLPGGLPCAPHDLERLRRRGSPGRRRARARASPPRPAERPRPADPAPPPEGDRPHGSPAAAGHVAPTARQDPALGLSQRAKFEILGAILLGLFLAALDQTVVGTALPRIVDRPRRQRALHVWVDHDLPADQHDQRPVLRQAVRPVRPPADPDVRRSRCSCVGSVLSGLSQEMWQLILFRGIQGLGAGALFPIALAVIGDLFTPAERGKYQGLFGAVFGVSSLDRARARRLPHRQHQLALGLLRQPADRRWSSLLRHLAPAAADQAHRARRRNLDYLGARSSPSPSRCSSSASPTRRTPRQDWTDPWVGGLIAPRARARRAIFVWIESRAAEPIVPLGLFRNRAFTVSVDRDVPGGVRVLRRRRLPAALVPDRRGRQRHRVGLPDRCRCWAG